jgi:hypothetical protein
VIGFASESKESVVIIDPIDRVVEEVIQCESGGRQKIWGDCDEDIPYPYYCKTLVCAKKYHCKAHGCAQFWRDTFNWLAGLSKRKGLKIDSEQDQRWLLKWAIINGYGWNWTCYKEEG